MSRTGLIYLLFNIKVCCCQFYLKKNTTCCLDYNWFNPFLDEVNFCLNLNTQFYCVEWLCKTKRTCCRARQHTTITLINNLFTYYLFCIWNQIHPTRVSNKLSILKLFKRAKTKTKHIFFMTVCLSAVCNLILLLFFFTTFVWSIKKLSDWFSFIYLFFSLKTYIFIVFSVTV